jgi:serine phosphatase RsbU (regulator of sigma subunit)
VPGQSLLFYTDGLVERRDRPIMAGLNRLAAAVTGNRSAEEQCLAAMTAMLENDQPRDDVAMLALRRTGAP